MSRGKVEQVVMHMVAILRNLLNIQVILAWHLGLSSYEGSESQRLVQDSCTSCNETLWIGLSSRSVTSGFPLILAQPRQHVS